MNRQQLATERALRILPSHGWTAGWIGRRDRALIVLSQLADLPYEEIARLAAGDISFGDDGASIAGTGRPPPSRRPVTACCARPARSPDGCTPST